MLSFLEKDTESHDLNRSWGVCYALPLSANVGIRSQWAITTYLDFGIFCRWTFELCHQHLHQLQHQIQHHLQSQIPTIAAYVQETSIYFLQFLRDIVHITWIINIGSLVGAVVGDIIDAIARCWTQTCWSPLHLQKDWKL